jgi:alkylation response protein AidB-like acyl-CoA dehydrogenase
MAFDFSLTPRVEEWRDRITRFVDDVVIPREQDAFDEAAVLLEEAGRSLLGPLALNCSAPDEGNIHMLHMIATEEQRRRYLLPLVADEILSCFAMTEPPPGAGSDPAALRTTATKVAGGWTITGDKHLITGAEGAAFTIVMAADATGCRSRSGPRAVRAPVTAVASES